MRRLLALVALLTSALVVLVVVPGAAADDTPCVGTLPAGPHDNVVVPPGATCTMIGATVRGNVKALENSRLRIQTSNVGGNVIGDKAAVVQATGNTVREDIIVKEARGGVPTPMGFFSCQVGGNPCEARILMNRVQVGSIHVEKVTGSVQVNDNNILLLTPNPIRGNIKVEDSFVPAGTDFLHIFSNRVAQNLQVFKNQGMGSKFVTGNTVGENLQCFENDPPFSGGGNVARQAQGQCTAAPLP